MAKTVFFTFDDGPKSVTGEVLDVLKAHTCPSVFFLTGSGVIGLGEEKQRELTKRIQAEGHTLANHCFIHKPAKKSEYVDAYGNMTKPDQKAAFKKNLDDNISHFRKLLGDDDLELKLVRLPGDGRFHDPSVAEVGNLGFKHIGWDYEFAPNGTMGHIGHEDWQGVTGVACTFDGFPPNNNVVLVHDAHWAGKMDLLFNLLKKFKDNDYVFKAIPG